jgi:hypothetical protein
MADPQNQAPVNSPSPQGLDLNPNQPKEQTSVDVLQAWG